MYVVVLFLFEMQRYKKLLYIRCYSDKKYYLRSMLENKDYTQDEIYGERLLIRKKSVPVLYFRPNYQAYSSIISALIPNFECSRLAIGIVIRLFPLSI